MNMKIEKVSSENFINCETLIHAYVLGLLWADGNVSFANNNAKTPIIKHNTKEDDFETFKNILNKTGDWNYFSSKNVGSYTKKDNLIYTNWTSNRKFGEYLIENKYREKSQSPDSLLNKLNDEEKELWYRGFFDGDGSVTVIPKGHHSIAFTGPKNQNWSFIENLFKHINIEKYKIRTVSSRGGHSSQIRITNKRDMIKFHEYLYNNIPSIGLSRKREKFTLL